MTEIAAISDDAFPIIDFKFQNRGLATASLHSFRVRIIEAEVVKTPAVRVRASFPQDRIDNYLYNRLQFKDYGCCDRSLHLHVSSDGLREEAACSVSISECHLNKLFTPCDIRFTGFLADGKELVMKIEPHRIAENIFDAIWREQCDVEHAKSQDPSIHFLDAMIKVRLTTQTGEVIISEFSLRQIVDVNMNKATRFYVNRNEFIWIDPTRQIQQYQQPQGQQQQQQQQSCAKYFISIDPEHGPFEKCYMISHIIAPGDVERFQLTLGAKKSCLLKVQFIFNVDEGGSVSSNIFYVKILAPHSHQYVGMDGDEYLSGELSRAAKLRLDAPSGMGEDLLRKMTENYGFPFKIMSNRQRG